MSLPSDAPPSPPPARRYAVVSTLLAAALVAGATSMACASADEDTVLVLAAASTIDAMESAVQDFRALAPTPVEVSFASTAILARQIEEGAPADLLLSASGAWADYLDSRVDVERRVTFVSNQLTVVVAAESDLRELPFIDIGDNSRFGSLAIADPASVPAGIYAAEAVRSAGLWEAVAPRLVPTLDVRAALGLVADGEVDAGFVYATDALTTPRVRVISRVPPELHATIEYPLLLFGRARPEAVRFYDYLISERGRAHFYDRGFLRAAG